MSEVISLQTNADWWDWILSDHRDTVVTQTGIIKEQKPKKNRVKQVLNLATPRYCPRCRQKYCFDNLSGRSTGRKLIKRKLIAFHNIPVNDIEICPDCK